MNELKYFKRSRQSEDELFETVVQLKIDDIRPNRAQPRSDFNQNSIIRLADSIRRYGILQPLTVRPSDPDDRCRYELIAGERRLRAAKLLGYLTVPCIIKEADEKTSAELAIIENLLREDLNMFEEAYGYKKLIEMHKMTQEEVARRMSVSQSAVANKMRLLKFGLEEQKFILENQLTERHARACLRLIDPTERFDTLKFIVENKLNVSQTEEYVEKTLNFHSNSSNQSASNKKDNANSHREMAETVSSIRRYVDTWVKHGKNAEINVMNKNDNTEIHIKLFN
ncbi:MAG: ParB/RepB/Spo0J family partition protein [Ruminococcaceae bacterium]|nr:ParB/RepB/Spo0J family partition protein [Oscillospiraceae bacterium]